jgi:hypothetical protein
MPVPAVRADFAPFIRAECSRRMFSPDAGGGYAIGPRNLLSPSGKGHPEGRAAFNALS